MPLRAVVFDYGMVLSAPPDPAAHQRLLELTQLPRALFEENYWRLRLDYDRGTLNGHTFWQQLARNVSIALAPDTIQQLIEQDVRLWAGVDTRMVRWAEQVRATGLRTAVLSNMGEELLAYIRNNHSWVRNFDHCTWSCEMRMVKPEAAIYRHTLEKLGVRAEETLFLDDREENVEGARKLGIHAVRYRGLATLPADLEQAGWARHLPPVPAPTEWAFARQSPD
jgi:putative hydrolase of the HAD superfamily